MKKNKNTTVFIVLGIVAVLYCCVVFLIPWERNTIFILSVCFSLLAISTQVLFWKIGWKDSENAQSRFYGLPVLRIGAIYLVLQLVLSFIFMLLSSRIQEWIPALIYLLLAGAASLGWIVTKDIKELMNIQDDKQKSNTKQIKILRSKANYLSNLFSGRGLDNELREIRELLSYSDPVSSAELQTEEEYLDRLLEDLKEALQRSDEELARKISDTFLVQLKQRNELCKMYK